MKNRIYMTALMAAVLTVLLSLPAVLCFAAKDSQKQLGSSNKDIVGRSAPSKPNAKDLEARREMVRKQQEQRITQKQRQTAADAYKAERLKVYKAKQTVKESAPQTLEKQ